MADRISRWDALDVLRGLTIIVMLLNMTPGSWSTNYSFITHVQWEGWALVDMVAPAFLFCIGVAMPLSFARRASKGDSRRALLRHVLWRAFVLVALGFALNLYLTFDFATVRIPSVLSRIGLCYGIAGALVVLTARTDASGALVFRTGFIAWTCVAILVSYWALLYFVPVPGFSAQELRGFEPVGNWAAYIDRAVIGTQHFFQHYPIDGQVVFDPEGILSTWPACFNVLVGALAGIYLARPDASSPALKAVIAGASMMILAYLLAPLCPMIKNIWTSTFALFSGGFALALLGLLMPITRQPGITQVLHPTRIFGENPLLAYIIVWLMGPIIDRNWFGTSESPLSLRDGGQQWLSQFLEPRAASLLFGLLCMAFVFAILLYCHRKRWILKI
jgi:predicted acyltransferase